MKTFCLLLAIGGVLIPKFIPEKKSYTPEQLMQPYVDIQKANATKENQTPKVSPALKAHAIVTF